LMERVLRRPLHQANHAEESKRQSEERH
jgi:hypothetical protein